MRDDFRLFKRKDKKVWYFYYYEDDKRIYKSTGCQYKFDAEEYARNFLKQGKNNPGVTLGAFAGGFFLWKSCPWIKAKHESGEAFSFSVAQLRRSHLTNHILPQFGHLDLREINPVKVESWLSGLSLAGNTRNQIRTTFNIILKRALFLELIPSNPLTSIKSFPTKDKKKKAFFPRRKLTCFSLKEGRLFFGFGGTCSGIRYFIRS